MKILLILAAAENDPLKKNDPFMPLSLPLLAASAPDNEYLFTDMLSGDPVDFKTDAQMVGISARATGEATAYQIADRFRAMGKTVILGGPQISARYDGAAEHADAVVIGEGEKLWPILLDDFKNGHLKKLYVAKPGAFDAKGLSVYQLDAFTDLATDVPRRARRDIYKRRYTFDTVFAARGCPMQCEFCSVTDLFGSNVRTRPIDHVVEEIASFKGFYYLLDDTVFGRPANYPYYRELYDRIIRDTKSELWMGQANTDAAATEEGRSVIIKAAQAGLAFVSVGIESINPAVLDRSGILSKTGVARGVDVVKQLKEQLHFIERQGIFISGWFPVGFDGDDYETVERNIQFCRETGIAPVVSPLEALPGTRLYRTLLGQGRLDVSKAVNIIHPHMTGTKLMHTIDTAMKRAYTLKSILWRSLRFSRYAAAHSGTVNMKIKNFIKKTSFVFILQLKMRKGLYGLLNSSE